MTWGRGLGMGRGEPGTSLPLGLGKPSQHLSKETKL